MKIKKINNNYTNDSSLTISDLRKNATSSVYGRLKIRLHALIGRYKRFYRSFKLPTIATVAFLLIILSLSVVRQLERTSLIALIDDVTDGSRYTSLLSADQADEFIRNDTTENSNQQNNQQDFNDPDSQQANTTQSNSTSFSLDTTNSPTVNPSPSTGSQTTIGGDGGNADEGSSDTSTDTPPAAPFSSSIESFARGSTTLQCNNPSKQNKGSCSKVYTFNSDIQTLNGPGSVQYSWQSNISSGNGNGTFTVRGGNALTAVSKQVSLGCNKDATFTIQIAIISPITSSSNAININHNCNEL